MCNEKEQILRHVHNDIVPLEDETYHFYLHNKGFITAHQLRIIADEIDRLNKLIKVVAKVAPELQRRLEEETPEDWEDTE